MITLICKRIVYNSQQDENVFFDWLEHISCIQNIRGVGDELHLDIINQPISDNDLKELNAIFKRYEIDRKQLEILKKDKK